MSVKNSNDTIGNRTHDLPACSAVPQLTASPQIQKSFFFLASSRPVLWTHIPPNFVTFRQTIKVKVKCTLVQALRLCTGRTGHRGSRGIALLFLDYGTRR